jgi:peptide/nickel transport system ATP-binding protein
MGDNFAVSIPRSRAGARPGARAEAHRAAGDFPSPSPSSPACHFPMRCPYAFDRCRVEPPALVDVGGENLVSCHLRGKRA